MDTALLIADLNRVYSWDLAPANPERPSPENANPEASSATDPSPEKAAAGRSSETAEPTDPSPEDALETQLAEKINTLIQDDFGALVQLLYRIDVPEQKLRRMLEANNGEDAGRLIARLIMERQWQKIESRRQYRQDNADHDADASENADTREERW
jgi:hypothetical protein